DVMIFGPWRAQTAHVRKDGPMTNIDHVGGFNPVRAPQDVNNAQVGGQAVRRGLGERIRAALRDAAHSVGAFFSGLKTRYDNWQEGRAVAQAERRADVAADKLIEKLRTGDNCMGALDALMKHSARVDGTNPQRVALEKLQSKMAALRKEERNALVFKNFDN